MFMRKGSWVKDVTRGAALGEHRNIFHTPHSIYLTGSFGMVWEWPHLKREINGEPLKGKQLRNWMHLEEKLLFVSFFKGL